MSYNKLFELLEDNQKLKSLITNISNMSSEGAEIPFLFSATLHILEDDSPYANLISDKNKVALCNMIDKYFVDCYELYIEDLKLNKLLEFGCIEVYKVEASNGIRYATTNEVAQGIKGLIGENVYPAGEREYRLLCLLEWTFYGVNYFFRQAGYKLEYDSNGKAKTPYYQMIVMCANQMLDLFEWVSVPSNVENTLKRIKKMKKSHGYKYASYEKDEITEDITIKQLVSNIGKIFPRNSNNKEYRWAVAMSIKFSKNNYKLTPLEVSKLRKVYDDYAFSTNKQSHVDCNAELKDKCELILKNRYNTDIVINRNHFAYTIIDSLRKYNYTKCSAKQLSYIDEAYNMINKALQKKEEPEVKETKVISDTEIDLSLQSLSDAIGNGLFDNDED